MTIDVEKIEIMNVQPGDTVVISLKDSLPREVIDKVHSVLSVRFPKCKVLVLEDGAEIHLVRGID